MFNHWATGRSGLLPQDCVVATQNMSPKRCHFGRSFREGFDFWCQGKVFGRVLVGSRRSPACFLQGLAPPVVRWEVSYEGKSVKNMLEIWSGPKFREMFQTGQGGPPRHPKNPKKYLAQKGPGPNLGPRVGGMRRQPLKFCTLRNPHFVTKKIIIHCSGHSRVNSAVLGPRGRIWPSPPATEQALCNQVGIRSSSL